MTQGSAVLLFKVLFAYTNTSNLSVAFWSKHSHSSFAPFECCNLHKVKSKWLVLLSSYTYQCLILLKSVTEIYFISQRTKQLCNEELECGLLTKCMLLYIKSTNIFLFLQFEASLISIVTL